MTSLFAIENLTVLEMSELVKAAEAVPQLKFKQ